MRPLPITDEGGVLFVNFDDPTFLNDGGASSLRDPLYLALSTTPNPRVVMDLSRVDYLSSTGIALLIGTKRRVEAAEGHLVLFGLRPDIHDLFVTMRLASLFAIAPDHEAALVLLPPAPSL